MTAGEGGPAIGPAPDGVQRRPGYFGLTVQDFEDSGPIIAGDAISIEPVKRGRGRPRKAQGAVILDKRAPNMGEMAFLRAQIQGVPADKAADRYLGLEEKLDARSLRAIARRLMQRMVRVAREMPDSQAVLAALEELDATLPEAGAETPAPPPTISVSQPETPPASAAAELPTLEDFALERGAEDFSEAELREMYLDEYGVDPYASPAVTSPIPVLAASPVTSPSADGWEIAPAPLSAAERGAALQRKLDALAWLVPRMARAPLPDSLVGEWFAPSIAQPLRAMRVQRLGEMVRWINRTGRRWYDQVPGLGKARAHRAVAWLWAHELFVQERLDARMVEGIESLPPVPLPSDWAGQAITDVLPRPDAPAGNLLVKTVRGQLPDGQDPLPKRGGIVPMEYFAWPTELDGSRSRFRHAGPNRLDAANDPQALQAWFTTYVERKSAQTLRSYRMALERLVLWAVIERGRALSDLQPQDLVEFEAFLRAPPDHWVQRFPTKRASRDWRPLRGPLDTVSIRQITAAVQSMYRRWNETGYIASDPAAGVLTSVAARPTVDVMRSFAQQDIEVIEKTFVALPEGAAKNRLRAVIVLFQSTGVRAAEEVVGNWGDITPMRLDNEIVDQFQLRVLGKGSKERFIPLRPEVLSALRRHYDDRRQLEECGAVPSLVDRDVEGRYAVSLGWSDPERFGDGKVPLPPRTDGLPPASVPLIGILRRGRMPPVCGAASKEGQGRCSAQSVYADLKAFFDKVAGRSDLGAGAANFKKASAHWLRHTFAHEALAAGEGDGDLPTVQQLLGHASIATTGMYLKADLARRAKLVNSKRGWRLDEPGSSGATTSNE